MENKQLIYEAPKTIKELEALFGKPMMLETQLFESSPRAINLVVYSGIITKNKKKFYEFISQKKSPKFPLSGKNFREMFTPHPTDIIHANRIIKEKIVIKENAVCLSNKMISLGSGLYLYWYYPQNYLYNCIGPSFSSSHDHKCDCFQKYPKLLKMLELNGMWEEPKK